MRFVFNANQPNSDITNPNWLRDQKEHRVWLSTNLISK